MISALAGLVARHAAPGPGPARNGYALNGAMQSIRGAETIGGGFGTKRKWIGSRRSRDTRPPKLTTLSAQLECSQLNGCSRMDILSRFRPGRGLGRGGTAGVRAAKRRGGTARWSVPIQ